MARPSSRVSGVVTTGPLAPFVDVYVERLKERGYTPLSVVNLQRQMSWLSRWLEADGVSPDGLNEELIEASWAWSGAAVGLGRCCRGLVWCVCSSCCASWEWRHQLLSSCRCHRQMR